MHIEHQEFEHREHKTHKESSDHHLISHKEHFDENLFDLLLCYLTESHHLSGSIKVEYPSPEKIQQISVPLLATIISITPQVSLIVLRDTLVKEYYYNHNYYTPPDLLNYSLRGPPEFV